MGPAIGAPFVQTRRWRVHIKTPGTNLLTRLPYDAAAWAEVHTRLTIKAPADMDAAFFRLACVTHAREGSPAHLQNYIVPRGDTRSFDVDALTKTYAVCRASHAVDIDMKCQML